MNIPKEWPTEEMLKAAEMVDVHPYRDTKSYQQLVFEAMIAAAPTPPAQDDEPGEEVPESRGTDDELVHAVTLAQIDNLILEDQLKDSQTQLEALRKAAEEAKRILFGFIDEYGGDEVDAFVLENLRAALEGK